MFRVAVRAISGSLKRGRQVEGVDWQRTTKPIKYMLLHNIHHARSEAEKVALDKIAPGC